MSITLTNPLIITQGGVTLETDSSSAAMTISLDFSLSTPTAVLTYKQGTVSGVSLNPGQIIMNESIQLSINLTNGAWATTNNKSGTLSGAALTSLLTNLKGLRNSAETFAITNSVILGTQVSW